MCSNVKTHKQKNGMDNNVSEFAVLIGLRQAFIVDEYCSDYWPQKLYGAFCRQVDYWFVFCMLLLYCG